MTHISPAVNMLWALLSVLVRLRIQVSEHRRCGLSIDAWSASFLSFLSAIYGSSITSEYVHLHTLGRVRIGLLHRFAIFSAFDGAQANNPVPSSAL
jgi:hypothetical protein